MHGVLQPSKPVTTFTSRWDCTDNWVLGRGTGGTTIGGECASQATAGASINTSDEGSEHQPPALTVRLIDFGRALSACERTAHSANRPARRGGSAQVRALDALYSAQMSCTADPDATDVLYRGDVSCKGYQCLEMQRGQPWSYQVRLY